MQIRENLTWFASYFCVIKNYSWFVGKSKLIGSKECWYFFFNIYNENMFLKPYL